VRTGPTVVGGVAIL